MPLINRLFFLIILLPVLVNAQNKYDSLHTKFQQLNPSDSEYYSTAALMLDEYYYEGMTLEGIEFGNALLEKSSIENFPLQEARISNRLATLYNNMGGSEVKALTLLSKALDIYRDENYLYGQGWVLNNLGNIYRDLYYDKKALDYYERSLKICEEIGDEEGKAFALKNIAIVYEYEGWFEKALEYHKKALEIRREINETGQQIASLLNVGIAYLGLNHYDSAMIYLDSALEKCKVHNSVLYDDIKARKGELYLIKNSYPEAITCYHEALNYALEYSQVKSAIDYMVKLAEVYRKSGQTKRASEFISKSKLALDTIEYVRGKQAWMNQKYQMELTRGNEIGALRIHRDMSQYNDSLNQVFSSEDMIQKRTAMDLLEKESELIMERERQESQQRFFINLILFMGLIIIILIVFFFLKRRDNLLLKKQQRIIDDKNKELAQVNNDLQATNEELTAANETIASQNQTLEKEVELRTKELIAYSNQLEQFTFMAAHNLRGPVARLTGLGNLLKMGIEEKEKNDVIDRIMNNTREIDHVLNDLNEILEIKSGVSRLISEVDLKKSLEHARTILKEDIEQAQAELEVDFQVQKVSAVKAYIESIFYNLISNALKYRSPNRKLKLKITSSYHEGQIRLSFSDNGIGIDMQKYGEEIFSIYKRFHSHKDGRGMGLFLVKSQINILGGEIHIESEVDQGTTFHIDFQKEFKPVILENGV